MSAKQIVISPISASDANYFVKNLHYSGKVVPNSQLHLGVFLENRLHGVMQFGPSLRKDKIIGLVLDTQWHEFLELNRMVFDDVLPRNSESRALSIAWRLLRKHAPQVKWVISFADGTQCGDGAIYRAAGFVLTGIKKNTQLAIDPNTYKVVHKISAFHKGREYEHSNWEKVAGFQLRYIYFIDTTYRARLTVPELPYSTIEAMGAKMYKGQRPIGDTGEIDNAAQSNEQIEGASPIVSLSLDGAK